MKGSRTRSIMVALCLGLVAAPGVGHVVNARTAASPPAQVVDVDGRGWKTVVACLGCFAAGATLVATGGWVTAIYIPGSALAAAGCAAACHAAIFE